MFSYSMIKIICNDYQGYQNLNNLLGLLSKHIYAA
jgi:hypothetical protein